MPAVLVGALKSKTMWWNVATLAATIAASDQLAQIITPAYLVEVQAIANILLRVLTTKPLDQK